MVESLWHLGTDAYGQTWSHSVRSQVFFKGSMAWKGLAQPARQLGSPEHQPRGVSSLSGAGPNHLFQGKRQHPGGLFLLGADREALQIRARCEAVTLL